MVEVKDNPDESRFEIFVDGARVGLLMYRLSGDVMTTQHTEIDRAFGNQGYGRALVKSGLDQIREARLRVRPMCSFVRAYISDHPEYQDMVAES